MQCVLVAAAQGTAVLSMTCWAWQGWVQQQFDPAAASALCSRSFSTGRSMVGSALSARLLAHATSKGDVQASPGALLLAAALVHGAVLLAVVMGALLGLTCVRELQQQRLAAAYVAAMITCVGAVPVLQTRTRKLC